MSGVRKTFASLHVTYLSACPCFHPISNSVFFCILFSSQVFMWFLYLCHPSFQWLLLLFSTSFYSFFSSILFKVKSTTLALLSLTFLLLNIHTFATFSPIVQWVENVSLIQSKSVVYISSSFPFFLPLLGLFCFKKKIISEINLILIPVNSPPTEPSYHSCTPSYFPHVLLLLLLLNLLFNIPFVSFLILFRPQRFFSISSPSSLLFPLCLPFPLPLLYILFFFPLLRTLRVSSASSPSIPPLPYLFLLLLPLLLLRRPTPVSHNTPVWVCREKCMGGRRE